MRRSNFWAMVMKFENFMKTHEICQLQKLKEWDEKINLRSVLDVKIRRCPALRAIFKISAGTFQ